MLLAPRQLPSLLLLVLHCHSSQVTPPDSLHHSSPSPSSFTPFLSDPPLPSPAITSPPSPPSPSSPTLSQPDIPPLSPSSVTPPPSSSVSRSQPLPAQDRDTAVDSGDVPGDGTPGRRRAASVDNRPWTTDVQEADLTVNATLPTTRTPNVTTPCATHPRFQGEPTVGDRCVYTLDQHHGVCQLHLTAPPGKIMEIHTCDTGFGLKVTVQQYERGKRLYPDIVNRLVTLVDIYTFTNDVVLHITPRSFDLLPKLMKFSYSIANGSEAPRMRVRHLSPSLGLIHSPQIKAHRAVADCVTLRQPRSHVIFVSKVPATRVEQLSLFASRCGQKPLRATTTGELPVLFPDGLSPLSGDEDVFHPQSQDRDPPMAVYYAHFRYLATRDGFTLTFSFYRNTSKPRQMGRQWNCSRAVWPDLPRHFAPCDLIGQCVQGEDEEGCPFTSQMFGPGYITAGDSQVFVVDTGVDYGADYFDDYTETETDCETQGGQPASLPTPQQWRDIIASFSSSQPHVRHNLWIDLRPAKLSVEDTADIYTKNMYIDTWQWGSGSIAYYLHPSFSQTSAFCDRAVLKLDFEWKEQVKTVTPCHWLTWHGWEDEFKLKKLRLCQKAIAPKHGHRIVLNINWNVTASRVHLVTCPMQHVTHAMLACDQRSLCAGRVEARGLSSTVTCRVSLTHTAPYFSCMANDEHVPYSVVCDWTRDCGDDSDESFCQFPPCGQDSFDCGQGQCIQTSKVCNRRDDCKSFADERSCKDTEIMIHFNVTAPPALVNFDRPGSFTVTPLPASTPQCPATHYQCPGDGYCLPVFTRCNDMLDCPGHEDEAGCEGYTCEGLYRCRGLDRTICLHGDHLCDGWAQCPHQDDEVMCGRMVSCPDQCVCYGTHVYRSETVLHLRYLEGRGTGLTPDVIANHTMLIHLDVGACGWRNVSNLRMVNLHVLDLSDNLIQVINFQHLSQLKNLKELVLAGNPLSTSFSSLGAHYRLVALSLLNLSRVPNQHSNLQVFSDFMPRMKVLDLSQSGLTTLSADGLFRDLTILNLRGCPISEFSPDFMKEMDDLKHVAGDNFKLCCSAMLPGAFTGKCLAPADEISSCQNLLKSGLYGVFLFVFALLALFGNLGSCVYRLTLLSAGRSKAGFLVFVIHLTMSDFLMGVYLSILGVTDRLYAGSYPWKEMAWKRSAVCHTAGFLSLLSCEVSSFLICLITLDRFLVIRFPFSQLRFGSTSAQVACGVIWGLGIILASIPLLPVTSHWAFYSQTGICIPLPVTRADFPGRHYSFAVMIVVNFVLFLLIAVGQAFIYWSVRVNTLSNDTPKNKDDVTVKDKTRSKEFTIARRLLVIAMSDFLCWFPVGVCGLLAKLDIPVPGEVNAAMATIVLPVNAALNPFLYTYTILRQKRQKEKEAGLQRMIIAQVRHELAGSHR